MGVVEIHQNEEKEEAYPKEIEGVQGKKTSSRRETIEKGRPSPREKKLLISLD